MSIMIHFTEKQKIKQIWVKLLLYGVAIYLIYGCISQVFLGIPFGERPISNIGLLIISSTIIAVVYLILIATLETQINTSDGICYRWTPFSKKYTKHPWNSILKIELINYSFFVGFGYRITKKYGIVNNASGNKGLLITLKNGKRLLGTNKSGELEKVITEIYKTNLISKER